jgi:hypothetical protein
LDRKLGEQMTSVAAKLGITTQEASQLSRMARLTRTDFGELQSQTERLQSGLAGVDMNCPGGGEGTLQRRTHSSRTLVTASGSDLGDPHLP